MLADYIAECTRPNSPPSERWLSAGMYPVDYLAECTRSGNTTHPRATKSDPGP